MRVVSDSVSTTSVSAENQTPPPVLPLRNASNASHLYVRLPVTLTARFDDSAPPHSWLPPLRQRLPPAAVVASYIPPLQFPRQQQEVIAALSVLAERPEQLSAEQLNLLKSFSAGGGEMLKTIARDMDYHATFNPDFGNGRVDFYGLPADVVKTPYALNQVGFRHYREDGGGKNFHATTFYYHFHAWSCLNGIVKRRPLRVNIPLHASEQALLTFFNQAEQHMKASQDNEKMVLAALAKVVVSQLISRPEWFSSLSAEARSKIISGADFPLLHHMTQLLPDNAPLQQRFTDNQYYEWQDGAFRSTRNGEILQESAPVR